MGQAKLKFSNSNKLYLLSPVIENEVFDYFWILKISEISEDATKAYVNIFSYFWQDIYSLNSSAGSVPILYILWSVISKKDRYQIRNEKFQWRC